MLTLIKNAEVYAPEYLGRTEVLIAGQKVMAVAPNVDLSGAALEVIDATGLWLLPGMVDALTHPCGGGGEGGFGNRTEEVPANAFIQAGITSPAGALGTDSIGRSLDVLYACVMSLRARGLAAVMYTGAYRVPAVTVTGDITRDIVMLEPVIGIGEVAISDHRSSMPTVQELRRLAAEARLGGTLAGKAGTVLIHVGDGPAGLQPLREALSNSDLPADTYYPTHANRNAKLFQEAVQFALSGATIDFTASTTPEFIEAGEIPALAAARQALAAGVAPESITISSDAGGSLPLYVDGVLQGLQSASPAAMLEVLQEAAAEVMDKIAIVPIIAALSANPARVLGLTDKGQVEPGKDADLLLFDPQRRELNDVICQGRWLMRDGDVTPHPS